MTWLVEFWRSALGKKAIMAITGLMLFGFVFGHMLGNLKLYYGPGVAGEPAAINQYAAWLREIGTPALPHNGALWLARIGLLGAVLLHIVAAWQVTQMNRRARPEGYRKKRVVQADYATRTMRWGGVIILFYIVYHLLHLTTGAAHGDFIQGDVYHNVVSGFSHWWVSLIYIIANVMLGFHLYHGLWSLFQSLGWNHPRFNALRRGFATAFALIISLGNISFPIAVLSGLVS